MRKRSVSFSLLLFSAGLLVLLSQSLSLPDVHAPPTLQLIDSYGTPLDQDEVTRVSGFENPPHRRGAGQSFLTPSSQKWQITQVTFYLSKVGNPTGPASINLYLATGTCGTSAIPSGSPLASGSVAVTTLSTAFGSVDAAITAFDLFQSTCYVVAFEYSGGDDSNYVQVGLDKSAPTYVSGNAGRKGSSGSWTVELDKDLIFRISGYKRVDITVTSSPGTGSGFVEVDDIPRSTPFTTEWLEGDTRTIEAISPVGCGVGCRFEWTLWSDGASQSHAVTVPGTPITYTATFTKEWSITLAYALAGSPSGSPTDPTLNYGRNQEPQTATLSTTPTAFWIDDGFTWHVTPNPLSPSGSTERWFTTEPTSGTATASTSVTITYYHQYALTLSYVLSGSPPGNPSAPVFSSGRFGSAVSETLTTSATGYWFDAGAGWSVENPLAPFTSIERWFTSQSTSGIVTGPQTILFNYYHQFLETFSYAVVGGGSSYSAPTFTANRFGSPLARVLATTPTSEWFDAGSSWSVTNPLGGSTATERWATSQQTGTVVGSQTLVFNYYRQFLQALAYFVSASGSGYGAPTFTANRFGSSFGQVLTGTVTDYWFDAGSEWELTPIILPLSGSIASERWLTPQPSSGLISASQRIVFYFNQHQFYVKVTSTISGPVLSGEGWYDDSALATFSASTPYVVSAEERYVFATWTGDIYSASSTVTLQMTRPLTVTATWTRQFLLRFQASGVPDGTGLTVRIAGQEGTFTTPGEVALWFDAGKEYALEAPVPFSFFASGSLYVFASWRNEAETAITTFQLNSPTTLVALYETSQGGVRLPIQWENQQGEALLFTDTNVLEFRYNPAWRAVTFTLEGSSSFILIVPKAMFLGDPVMLFDGQLVLPPDLGVTSDQSGSNYVISYSFPPGQRTFIVGGSQVIPEFPHIYLLAILFLSLALARFATHAKRKTAAAEAWRYVHSSP